MSANLTGRRIAALQRPYMIGLLICTHAHTIALVMSRNGCVLWSMRLGYSYDETWNNCM